ncbi:hypothetical protein HPB50_009488 [Hyalomma asiaticum]|uniref:Uncharacterized protein n=1 Tax=Hyalomma asiaticum TaxID=266040 RepID=A0ACB7SFV8_HYAAI|nr:hypothetical protein HPB50_009488 [Hyalomma asiaticum]
MRTYIIGEGVRGGRLSGPAWRRPALYEELRAALQPVPPPLTSACARRRGAAPGCGCWPTRLQRKRADHMQDLPTSQPGLPRHDAQNPQIRAAQETGARTHATTRPRIATLVALRPALLRPCCVAGGREAAPARKGLSMVGSHEVASLLCGSTVLSLLARVGDVPQQALREREWCTVYQHPSDIEQLERRYFTRRSSCGMPSQSI